MQYVQCITDDQAIQFFQKLKRTLNYESTQKTVGVVRTVLSRIPNWNADQVQILARKTPDWFYMFFISCMTSKKNDCTTHVDELVSDLTLERSSKELFKSEMETLNVVMVILKKLQNLLNTIQINIFPYTLSQELKEVVLEEAS